jgi:hypothetical protein
VPSKVSLGYAYMPRTTNRSSGVSEHSPEAAYLHFYDLEPGTIQAVRYITQKRPVENRRHIYLSSGMPAIAHHLDCEREGYRLNIKIYKVKRLPRTPEAFFNVEASSCINQALVSPSSASSAIAEDIGTARIQTAEHIQPSVLGDKLEQVTTTA